LVLNGEVAAVVVRIAERRQVVTPRCLVRHVSETTRRTVRAGGLGGLAALSPDAPHAGPHAREIGSGLCVAAFRRVTPAFLLGGGSVRGSPEEVGDGAGSEDRDACSPITEALLRHETGGHAEADPAPDARAQRRSLKAAQP